MTEKESVGMEELKQEEGHQAEQQQPQMLVNQNEYLEEGIHIATKVKAQGMERFVYKVREDGLFLLDIAAIDERIRIAAKMLARYDPSKIVVTASRTYAIFAAEKFATLINAKFIKGRVEPGVFTNPNRKEFMEPELIFISDSRNEKQAVNEASKSSITVMALSDTDNLTKFVDFIIPVNNRGRRSLAFVYYLLSREVMRERGSIKSNEEFQYKIDDFEAKLETR